MIKLSNMTQRQAVTSLRFLYPIWTVFGMFSLLYVPSTLIAPENAATTANNIMTNELLFRTGIVGSLITQLLFIIVVLVLYNLFKTVNKDYSLLMVIFALVGVPIAMLNELNHFAVLPLLGSTDYSQIMLFVDDLYNQGILIASIFWGLWLFPLGYLIFKSGYFSKALGALVAVAGFGYLLGSFTHFLFPDYKIVLLVFELMTFGEVIFVFWLLIKGAKIPEMKS